MKGKIQCVGSVIFLCEVETLMYVIFNFWLQYYYYDLICPAITL